MVIKMKKKFIYLIIIMLILIIGYFLYKIYVNIDIEENYKTERTALSTNYEQNVENIIKNNKKISDIIEETTKSVCGISKFSTTGNSILSTINETELGLGTGIIVSSNGYILSNSHVTGEKYSSCYVKIEGKDTYKGTVLWADAEIDLSIVKINIDGLKAANLGNSKEIRVGENVYAIGNPVGYEFRRTVTSGIISAVNRTVKLEEDGKKIYMSDLIQTDATINPGNSGGPLISAEGKVIGINSVKITSAEGIGFAVPIDVIKPVINSFIKNNSFEQATLGVYVYDNTIAQYLNKKYFSGIYISEILKEGALYGKGIKEGETITKIDNKKIETVNDLREYIYEKKPNDRIKLTINNGRYDREIEVILRKK